MPIKIPDNLPAAEVLNKENIFVMSESRAYHQDIRTLKIAILNLMPTKIITETQILRLISNTPLQVEVTLLHPKTHISKNTSGEHLARFYKTFEDVKEERFDGMIITGAPVEHLEFEEVNFWDELKEIMQWSRSNVYSTLHICWAAQAGLFYHYGVKKHLLAEKVFGVFTHRACKNDKKLLRGFDDLFDAPHSRYTEIRRSDIEQVEELEILAESKDAGLFIIQSKDERQVFVTGHSEYEPLTLKLEYERDVNKGLNIAVPKNYFPKDDPQNDPKVTWRGHGGLLFANWLNYYVYQETPFDLDELMYYI